MLVKRTAENRVTLPEAILRAVPAADSFEVTVEAGRIVLTPVGVDPVEAIQERLRLASITEQDVDDAVAWARSRA